MVNPDTPPPVPRPEVVARAVAERVYEWMRGREDYTEACSCEHNLDDVCWYHLTDEQKRETRLVHLTDVIQAALRDAAPPGAEP